ncbi:MAG: hypothetical protein ACK5XA_08465 [Tagaea sp.]
MPIYHHQGGGTTLTDEGIKLYRAATILSGLRLQKKGIKLTRRAPACSTIVRNEFGFKGSLDAQIEQMEAYVAVLRLSVQHIDTTGDGRAA